MLLEYNPDTNENNLHERAIQLRQRVAGRKLEEAVKQNVVDSEELIYMKEKNKQEREAQVAAVMELTEFELKERVAFQRAEQHLAAIGQVSVLGKDVTRATRLGKARLDSLNDLERRIMNMRSQLHDPKQPLVESVISQELRTNNKLVKLENNFGVCSNCNRRILSQLLPTHERMCKLQTKEKETQAASIIDSKSAYKGVLRVDETIVTNLATFKPQPPRNFKVISKGISFIHWQWDPPVIDGGLEIVDYEISYRGRFSEFLREVGKYHKWEIEVPSLKTTHWLFRFNPVCHHGFKICNLRAGGEYYDFKIRSLNLRGYSDWVPMFDAGVETFVTDPAAPPTAPLFVTVEKTTSTCIHLSWSPPYFDGGVPLTQYIVYYTVVELVVTVRERGVRVEQKKEFATGNIETNAVIRNLPDDSDIIEIYVCAQNSEYLIGAKGSIKQALVHTHKSSRYTHLKREMTITAEWKEDYIDSAFFTVSNVRNLVKPSLTH